MSTTGILTMCHHSDWHKAIGLSLSLKARGTTLLLAVVAPEELQSKLEPYFDIFISERSDLKGFAHKIYLDEYSPFSHTLFLDADILAMRDPKELIDRWAGHSYMARGYAAGGGTSSFGLDRSSILKRLNKKEFACIDGAGHAYFETPSSHGIFHRAREILNNYQSWAPHANIADEDILGIVLTELGIKPEDNKQIIGFPKAIKRPIKKLDATTGNCEYIDLDGDRLAPLFIHFPRDMSPILYHRQLRSLSKKFKGPQNVPWLRIGLKEWLRFTIYYGLKKQIKLLLPRNKTTQDPKI